MTAQDAPPGPLRAEISHERIRHNISELIRVSSPASVAAVVKANGYGHGAVEVAETALSAGAVMLCVATPEEGAALRDAGLDAPILLLIEPNPDGAKIAVDAQLILSVSSVKFAEHLASHRTKVSTHACVNTGMNREGCTADELPEIFRILEGSPNTSLDGVWSHLACADEIHNSSNAKQIERFRECTDKLNIPMRHLANSAGAIAHPDARFDMVRCGIATYGLLPGPELEGLADLRPALTLKSEVGLTRRLETGDSVSYGHRWTADTGAVVATVRAGYADGVPRNFPDPVVLINNKRRRVLGTVTMDTLVVEVDEETRTGDEVVLIGEQGSETVSADEWAKKLGTINYEVTTGISARVPRVHR